MTINREEFVQQITELELVSSTDLQDVEKRIADSGGGDDLDTLTRTLVTQYRLSEYQVEVICQQRKEPLFVGDYVILDKIGQGGMGMVYKARPTKGHHLVAVKVLPPDLSEDPNAVKRFQREVRLSEKLVHPNIVAARDHGEHEGHQFYVMEFVDGENLAALVKLSPPLPMLSAVDYITDAARGLEFAHGHGIIHRDMKPSNLLIHRDGTAKILDMGLAREAEGRTNQTGSSTTVTELTRAGAVMGTADYIAPEQALNAKNADERSDIYSLGCTLYFALTGGPVFHGETIMEKLVAHREEPIPSLRDARDDVPPDVDRIFQKMLAKDPTKRYRSMSELLADLGRQRTKFGHMWMIRRFITEQKRR